MDENELNVKRDKAKIYATQPKRFQFTSFEVNMMSDHDDRTIVYSGGKWQCTCEFYQQNQTCSHIMALQSLLDNFRFG